MNSVIQNLKKQLSKHYRIDVNNLLIKKQYSIWFIGGSIGTSLNSEDTLMIHLRHSAPAPKIDIYINFRQNVNKLFYAEYFKELDRAANINTFDYRNNPVNLARVRILRAVYETLQYYTELQDFELEGINSIDASVDEETGDIDFTLLD